MRWVKRLAFVIWAGITVWAWVQERKVDAELQHLRSEMWDPMDDLPESMVAQLDGPPRLLSRSEVLRAGTPYIVYLYEENEYRLYEGNPVDFEPWQREEDAEYYVGMEVWLPPQGEPKEMHFITGSNF